MLEKMIFQLLLLLLISVCSHSSTNGLEKISDNDFIDLTAHTQYIAVLFTKPKCPECDAIEKVLVKAREELQETLSAVVVKIENSNFVQRYNPNKEPSLVLFRYGVPLLYNGRIDDEDIVYFFNQHKEPIVRELDDSNFEHLTQAATGATTSDWLVLFYKRSCVTSQRLMARWEAVGAELKTRMNVARVNMLENGVATAKRFHVTSSPTFILFRLGKMYRYEINDYDIQSFVNFATGGFKKIAKSERVPLPKTPFDDLTEKIADYMSQNNWVMLVGGIVCCMILALLMRMSKKEDEVKDKGKEKDKDKDKEKEKEKDKHKAKKS